MSLNLPKVLYGVTAAEKRRQEKELKRRAEEERRQKEEAERQMKAEEERQR